MISFLVAVKQPVRILLLVLYVVFLAALSILPPQDLPKVSLFYGADKIIHFMMYFIFSMLSCWALKTEKHYFRLLLIVLATIGWGMFMEFVQMEMHMGRSFSFYDMVANGLGVFVGVIIYVLTTFKRNIDSI
jgi:VanZ family protein